MRSDIRSSFGGLSGTAAGVPLTIELTIVAASTCAVRAGRAVYLWHCDALGRYSLCSAGATNQNYLRGVQEADANGKVTFTSIFPGCYAGRYSFPGFDVTRYSVRVRNSGLPRTSFAPFALNSRWDETSSVPPKAVTEFTPKRYSRRAASSGARRETQVYVSHERNTRRLPERHAREHRGAHLIARGDVVMRLGRHRSGASGTGSAREWRSDGWYDDAARRARALRRDTDVAIHTE